MSKEKVKNASKKKIKKVKEDKYSSRLPLYSFFVIAIVVLVCIAQYFLTLKNDNVLASINYNHQGTLNYKVYYKENPFYSEKYLTEGKTYISQYVDYIDVDFEYIVNYTKKLSGSYNYFVKAKLVAYTPGDESDDLWNKEYKLTDLETVDYKNDNSYYISKNIKVDYNKFLKDYLGYRSNNSVPTEAKLIVELVVNNNGEYAGIDDLNFEDNLVIEVPVSSSTFKITKQELNDSKTATKLDKTNMDYIFTRIIVTLCWLLAIFMGVSFIIVYRNDIVRISLYERKLKKIITTYNSIIVNVENLPLLSDISVVDVTSFDELVDAQSEVRLPINYKENKKRRYAKFILVSENIAWVYTLREGDINEKDS